MSSRWIDISYSQRLRNKLEELRPTPFDEQDKTIILVEGKLDKMFFSGLLKDRILGSVISVGALKIPDELINGNVKSAICDLTLNITSKSYSSKGLNVYGICDKDLDNEHSENSHLLFTDTSDLETLLVSNNIFSLNEFCSYDGDSFRTIYCQAYQLGGIRKAFSTFLKEENKDKLLKNKSFRDYFSESSIKKYASSIFLKNRNLDLNTIIDFFSKDKDNEFFEIKKSSFFELIMIKLRRNLYEDSFYKSANKDIFNYSVCDFDKKTIKNYWNNVRGHDLMLISKTMANGEWPKDEEQFMLNHSNIDNFKSTELFKKMLNANIIKNW